MDRVVHNSGVIEEMKLRDKRRESKKREKRKDHFNFDVNLHPILPSP